MAINVAAKKSNYISKTVQAVTQIIEGYYTLRKLQDANTDQGFVEENKDYGLIDDDFVGENDHIDLQRFFEGLKVGIFPIIGKIDENNFEIRAALQKLMRT